MRHTVPYVAGHRDIDEIEMMSKLKSENDVLQRQLAQCFLCQRICSPEEHKRRLDDLQHKPKKLREFIAGIGKNERQMTLSSHFWAESQKNIKDFNREIPLTQPRITDALTNAPGKASRESTEKGDVV